MTALAADAARDSRNLGAKRQYLMAASTTIYKGSLVMINSSGLAVPASAENGNNGCVGVATEQVTSAASGSYYIEVQTGEFLFAATSITQAMVNDLVYADDDNTVDETATQYDPTAGIITQFVSTTSAWVLVDPLAAADTKFKA